jgi:hypothetical protein
MIPSSLSSEQGRWSLMKLVQAYADLLQGSFGSSNSSVHLAIDGILYGANRNMMLIPSQEASDLFGLSIIG